MTHDNIFESVRVCKPTHHSNNTAHQAFACDLIPFINAFPVRCHDEGDELG